MLASVPHQTGPFPAPGTTQWFQPAPPPYAPSTPARSGAGDIAQALTLGVIICLAVGGIVWPLAPVTLVLAFGLASRVKAGRPVVLGVFTAAVSVLVVVGVVAGLLSDGFFSDWWELRGALVPGALLGRPGGRLDRGLAGAAQLVPARRADADRLGLVR